MRAWHRIRGKSGHFPYLNAGTSQFVFVHHRGQFTRTNSESYATQHPELEREEPVTPIKAVSNAQTQKKPAARGTNNRPDKNNPCVQDHFRAQDTKTHQLRAMCRTPKEPGHKQCHINLVMSPHLVRGGRGPFLYFVRASWCLRRAPTESHVRLGQAWNISSFSNTRHYSGRLCCRWLSWLERRVRSKPRVGSDCNLPLNSVLRIFVFRTMLKLRRSST